MLFMLIFLLILTISIEAYSQIQICCSTSACLQCVITRLRAICSLKDCGPRVRLASHLFTTFFAGEAGIFVYLE